jgi:hypothetical protein
MVNGLAMFKKSTQLFVLIANMSFVFVESLIVPTKIVAEKYNFGQSRILYVAVRCVKELSTGQGGPAVLSPTRIDDTRRQGRAGQDRRGCPALNSDLSLR